MKELLFICTGNTCRSPMAEALCRAMLEGVRAASAGLWAAEGEPISDNAFNALMERGIDASAHRARRFTPALLGPDTVAVCMGRGHLEALRAIAPGARAVTLADSDISDPYGGPLSSYRTVCSQIAAALPALPERIEHIQRRNSP